MWQNNEYKYMLKVLNFNISSLSPPLKTHKFLFGLKLSQVYWFFFYFPVTGSTTLTTTSLRVIP